ASKPESLMRHFGREVALLSDANRSFRPVTLFDLALARRFADTPPPCSPKSLAVATLLQGG
ncbi:MAG TPA: hypothetical protein QF761_15590, partial [Pirellulales bacterium]|nr:hypothetical protein [Pirellulales bacterium]